MKNIPLLIGTILGTLLLVVGISFMFSGGSNGAADDPIQVDTQLAMGDARNSKVGKSSAVVVKSPEDESAMATDSADENPDQEMITVVEFSDFQCPACKSASGLGKLVTDTYPGKVKFVYRHFPLDTIHPNARNAAIAAEAVGAIDKEKFWDMHDLLFENQDQWSDAKSKKELNDIFVTYVEKLDIDRTQFLERIDDNSVIEMVTNDSNTGTQLGVNSTPTFYVDGNKVSAQQLLSTVQSVIAGTE